MFKSKFFLYIIIIYPVTIYKILMLKEIVKEV